jgi:protein-L-isoaspartate(D-aspartate) O-methyltransferase
MDYQQARQRMLENQIERRGIKDPLVLAAMAATEREKFVTTKYADLAYADSALPIECSQTISQPYIVAHMIEALGLKGGERVLEIGTGSGYAAAVLAKIAKKVITIECINELAENARNLLAALGYRNIVVITGDGTKGSEENAPFDGIVVTAGGPQVPQSLRQQLKIGGRMVIPVGPIETFQVLVRITRKDEHEYTEEKLCEVRFVPLVGAEGWHKSGW